MDNSTPSPRFDWEAASHESWKKFEQHVRLMFTGPLSGKTEKQQCAYLLLWLGEKGRDVYSTWTLQAEETDKIACYLEKFKEHISPSVNPVFARYMFHKRDQSVHESVEQYITAIRVLVKDCDYPVTTINDMVRDRIVCGILSPKIREKLLSEGGTLVLSKAIEIARAHETTQAQLSTMADVSKNVNIKQEIDSLHKRKQHQSAYASQPKQCYFCGGQYDPNHRCPAKGKICSSCGRSNHFARVCRSKPVHAVESGNASQIDQVFINTLFVGSVGNIKGSQPTAEIIVNKQESKIKFKIDTGAEANVMPVDLFQKIVPRPELKETKQILVAYGGTRIPVLGICMLSCTYNKATTGRYEFFVVKTKAMPILGYEACVDMGLVKVAGTVEQNQETLFIQKVKKDFADVFTGIGELQGECTIHLKPDAVPTVHPVRRIPFALHDKLKSELEQLEKQGIIQKVTTPTEWVNSIVTVEKQDGSLRLCLDPRDLNNAIQRPFYPMPTFEDIAARLHGHNRFTKLDAKSRYWMLKLSEPSSLMTTFNTPFGRYRYMRMPFGIVCAQDIFQQKMEETFNNLEGLGVIVDDIIVSGKDDEHDRNLLCVLERARKEGVKFNPEKCIFDAHSIPYFGHVITAEGIKPDPRKVQAIKEMLCPTSKEELMTFLGMVNFLSRYIPNLSTLNHSLRELGKQDTFQWTDAHKSEMEKIKVSICQNLAAFDAQSKEVELKTDASKHGLGAELLTHGQIVAFASKALNETEQRYSQIEKELYAIMFGCRKFHQYIYGRKVKLYTDHKPLETILSKPLSQAPPRLQRMMLQIQPYDLEVHYIRGKDIPVADALSRLHTSEESDDFQNEIEFHVNSFVKHIPVSDTKMEQIRKENQRDPVMQTLIKVIQEGWPVVRKSCPRPVIPYWNFREELAVVDGIILKADRIVIPLAIQPNILQQLHASHMGMEKTKQRARTVVFWPGMNHEIEEFVKSCESCGKYAPNNPRESLLSTPLPQGPWEAIGVDLCQLEGRNYLITSDYYSRFIEIDKLNCTTSSEIITKLKSHFARYGIPLKIRSDNGPQFSSSEFLSFLQLYDIQLCTSSPNFPQSNGHIEKAVDIAKRIMQKAVDSNSDPYLGLLEYRSTPISGSASPAQLLMSRTPRSILPTIQLRPKVIPRKEIIRVHERNQCRQKTYYDRHAKDLAMLSPNKTVWMKLSKEDKHWKKGIVLSMPEPRSYLVQTENGNTYRRNRVHLKPRFTAPGETEINIPNELVDSDESQSIAPGPLLEGTESPEKLDATSPTIATPSRFRVDENADVPATPFATPNPVPVNSNRNSNTNGTLFGPRVSRYGRPIKPRQIFDL